ncbi:hypothetical protein [Candidatus Nucleicultrix amoebiphila]|jgi:hypothetical protein|uniref:Uncharacterized protein n=1 Tax=Candidatus Nucleicultrix amoebiphila FS5 TaxID=1414854 RepID=A0A1W6N5R3_9PROT|nr:hypothetical protein [Candidatus Nucleicultrix amoebiphila]ARN85215.1 hypothetical protein GQ61_07875 [Candidatus Nucleicultrix amoebiphila FS5]
MTKFWRIALVLLAIFTFQGGVVASELQEESKESVGSSSKSGTGVAQPSRLSKGFWDFVEAGKGYIPSVPAWVPLIGKKGTVNQSGLRPTERDLPDPRAVSFWRTKKGMVVIGVGGIALAYFLAPETMCAGAGWISHNLSLSSLQNYLPETVLSWVGSVCHITADQLPPTDTFVGDVLEKVVDTGVSLIQSGGSAVSETSSNPLVDMTLQAVNNSLGGA